MQIIKYDQITRNHIITVLKKGGLIISPSDTVYGLLVDATNKQAVEKLIQFKNRPWGKPISVFVADIDQLKQLVEVDKKQSSTLANLLPGPFTIILKSKGKVSPLLESEKKTLGVRLPQYAFLTELVREFKKPFTATSANLSGRSPHYSISSLLSSLPKQKLALVDLIIDAGNLPRNKTSTIIDLTEPDVKTLRKGDLVFDEENCLISESPEQTKKIAQYLFNKYSLLNKTPVFILKGELGVGKTVFVKGIGELFDIKKIISPTFVIYYEYDIPTGKLYHFDLYQIEDQTEFDYLKIEETLILGNVLCFEWGEKSGAIIEMLKNKAKVVYVEMEYESEKERSIKYRILN